VVTTQPDQARAQETLALSRSLGLLKWRDAPSQPLFLNPTSSSWSWEPMFAGRPSMPTFLLMCNKGTRQKLYYRRISRRVLSDSKSDGLTPPARTFSLSWTGGHIMGLPLDVFHAWR